jgi:hypothetical protein
VGYSQGLEPLVGHLGLLDDRGAPRTSGATRAAPGLWYVGFMARPSLIGFVGKQSRRLAKKIANG